LPPTINYHYFQPLGTTFSLSMAFEVLEENSNLTTMMISTADVWNVFGKL